jgi:putative hydrolase of the HAD superfamily
MKFKGIGFDYGGVIAGQPSTIFVKKISKLLSISTDQFHVSYFRFNELWNKHSISMEDSWKIILKDLKKENRIDEVLEFIKHQPKNKINLKMLNLVDHLRDKGYKVGLFSNFTKQAANEMRKIGIDKHFHVFLVSAEIGVMKPDVKAFKIFAQKIGIMPSELIYIDDTEKSLSSSKEVGFHPILFKNYNSLIKELVSLDILDKSNI